MNEITLLAIDLAKSTFHLHGVDKTGGPVLKKKLSRSKLHEYLAQLPPCIIAMEACGGSHFWARACQALGHQVQLLSPQHVKPFVQGNKNDANDARAIAVAALQPNMPTVAIKTPEQQDIQMLHRLRQRHIQERTALSNQVRGFLMEFGITIQRGIHVVRNQTLAILADGDNRLTDVARREIHALYQKLLGLDKEIERFEGHLKEIAHNNPICQQFLTLRGVGLITATIAYATLADPSHFKCGRQFSAYLGLVPKEHSTGGKHRLMGISKRGNSYVRSLLIHGGRAVVRSCVGKKDSFSLWVQRIQARRGFNKASVAVANKNARYLWAMMQKGDAFVQHGSQDACELAATAV